MLKLECVYQKLQTTQTLICQVETDYQLRCFVVGFYVRVDD